MPARRGLQQTAQAATRHRAKDPLVHPQVDQTYIDKLDNHLDQKNLTGTNRILDSPFLGTVNKVQCRQIMESNDHFS